MTRYKFSEWFGKKFTLGKRYIIKSPESIISGNSKKDKILLNRVGKIDIVYKNNSIHIIIYM